MCRKMIYLFSFVLVLGVAMTSAANDVDPYLAGWWKLDGDAVDSSGNGRDGTLVGGPQYVGGYYGQALQLDGVDDYVEIVGWTGILGAKPITGSAWVRTTSTGTNNAGGANSTNSIVEWGPNTSGQRFGWRINAGRLRMEHHGGNIQGDTDLADGEWHHVAVTVKENATLSYPDVILWLDGQDDTRPGTDPDPFNLMPSTVRIGSRGASNDRFFTGVLDDVRIYERELEPSQVQDLFNGIPPFKKAYGPGPADGVVHGNTWVNLQWTPGSDAVSHDVYFGENFDDVAAGTGDTFLGNETEIFITLGIAGCPYPDGLVYGTTYYWRIDEAEADGTVYKGNVWSFSVPFQIATNPSPADGTKFADPNVTLSWTAGFEAIWHTVYFGENFDDVNSATEGPTQLATTYTPAALAYEKFYYWRVDETDTVTTHKGDVWSFRTKPYIPITDPNLVCYWTLNEGEGTIVVDWSGHGQDGTATNGPEWVDGYDGGALNFDGSDDSVLRYFVEETWSAYTMAVWAKADTLGQPNYAGIFTNRSSSGAGFQLDVDGTNPGNYRYHSDTFDAIMGTVTTDWVHLAVACNGTSTTLYYNGYPVTNVAMVDLVFDKFGIGINRNENWWFDGVIDDFRVYDKVLTQEEIKLAMRIDPLLAWDPNPANGSTPDIENVMPLSWTAGDNAAKHDVYFGIDKDAVENADTSDTTGIYRGRQSATSYSPLEGAEWGQGPYYWRIDEYNTDGTVSKGRLWRFTVADFILLDDIEAYDANDSQIWYAWRDGLGFGAPDSPPYYAGNGTGSAVGDETTASYTEETIVHAGDQSMPYFYNNSGSTGKLNYSEATLTLTSARDWTKHGTKALSLWFRGYPGSVGSFTEGPAGIYTMTGSGADITGTSDQFHFVFKMLTGPGSIVARVDALQNTNDWAKAGVMIRETLDPNSAHAFACITPANGVAFQGRTDTGSDSFSTNQVGIRAPYWVKLERDAAGNFTAYHSTDGFAWMMVENTLPTNIPMDTNVYIGLALTSHNAGATCKAVFSNVTISGNVGPQWLHQDVGISSNDAEPMYVAVANSTGEPAVVYHDDSNAAQIDTWTEWNIELKEFADKGVDLADVNSIAIGFGNRNNPQAGGSGKMFFDDIRLYQPRCVSSLLKPVADFSNNCIVDIADIEIMANDWLISGYDVTVAAVSDANLVLHYKFEGNAYDSSGKGNHGDPNGGVSYTAGKLGQAINLDGIDDYVAIQNLNYASSSLTEVTVCAWIRTSNPFDQAIASFDRNEYWRFEINGNGAEDGQLSWCVMTSGGQVDFGSRNRVDDGQWHHVTGVFDNGTLGVFIDGKLDNSTSGGNTFGTGNIRYGFVGSRSEADVFDGPTGVPWVFAGDLDDVRIYERALSQAEIANLAGLPAGEILHQPLQGLLSTIENVDLHDDERIDFKDFAVLAETWLDEQLWPAQ